MYGFYKQVHKYTADIDAGRANRCDTTGKGLRRRPTTYLDLTPADPEKRPGSTLWRHISKLKEKHEPKRM